jgi:hypothetical protein
MQTKFGSSIFVDQANLRLKLLAMHYNDDGILIQSLECPRELPVRPSAEQAVKVPLQPLQGSGDSAKRDKQSSFPP